MKELEVEGHIAMHLGIVRELRAVDIVDNDDVKNADETSLVPNVEKGRALGLAGTDNLK